MGFFSTCRCETYGFGILKELEVTVGLTGSRRFPEKITSKKMHSAVKYFLVEKCFWQKAFANISLDLALCCFIQYSTCNYINNSCMIFGGRLKKNINFLHTPYVVRSAQNVLRN